MYTTALVENSDIYLEPEFNDITSSPESHTGNFNQSKMYLSCPKCKICNSGLTGK